MADGYGYMVSFEIDGIELRPYHKAILTRNEARSIAKRLHNAEVEYKIDKGCLTSGGYFKEYQDGELTLEQLEKEPSRQI